MTTEHCQKPVIGAAHGVCYGGAIDLLSTCDIRFTASDAVFSIKEVDVGLAADIGTLQRFPKVVGNESWARELALTARVFKPDEALRFGFVSRIVQGSRKEVVGEQRFAGIAMARSLADPNSNHPQTRQSRLLRKSRASRQWRYRGPRH